MKILFITRKYPPQRGGMETFSANLVTALNGQVTALALHKSQVHLLWWLPVTFVRALWLAPNYDVIHLGDGLLAGLGVLLKLFTRKPVTVTVHGLDVTYTPSWYQRYIRYTLPKLTGVVAVSEPTANILKPYQLTATVIHHGIQVEDWPMNTELGKNNCLLYVGRMVPRKGCMWFVEHVLPQLPNAHLHIVGEGEQLADCKRLVERLQLVKRVRFHGNATPEQLREHYGKAQALVMPNLQVPGNVEGFGIVAIEAGASGLPVIASNLEGIRDAVIDDSTGILVESGSISAWVSAVQRIFTQPFTSETIRKTVAQHYGLTTMAERYQAFFSKQLN